MPSESGVREVGRAVAVVGHGEDDHVTFHFRAKEPGSLAGLRWEGCDPRIIAVLLDGRTLYQSYVVKDGMPAAAFVEIEVLGQLLRGDLGPDVDLEVRIRARDSNHIVMIVDGFVDDGSVARVPGAEALYRIADEFVWLRGIAAGAGHIDAATVRENTARDVAVIRGAGHLVARTSRLNHAQLVAQIEAAFGDDPTPFEGGIPDRVRALVARNNSFRDGEDIHEDLRTFIAEHRDELLGPKGLLRDVDAVASLLLMLGGALEDWNDRMRAERGEPC